MSTEFRPLNKERVADILGICVRTVDNWISDGTLIAPVKLGSRSYWHPRTFYAWLDEELSAPLGAVLQSATDSAVEATTSKAQPPQAKARTASTTKAELDAMQARDTAKLKALLG